MRNPPILVFLAAVLLALSACTARPILSNTASPVNSPLVESTLPLPASTPSLTATGSQPRAETETCQLQPIIVPTMPAKVPAPNELDETTGLHMTGLVQQIDLASYRLKVSGMVDRPLDLSLDELRCMPKVTNTVLLACYGLFTDSATWSGVPIKEVLDRAGVQAGAKTLEMVSADGLHATLPMEDALDPKNFLAYEMSGKPLPILHGFPLRAVLPQTAGGKWVKWLVELMVK